MNIYKEVCFSLLPDPVAEGRPDNRGQRGKHVEHKKIILNI